MALVTGGSSGAGGGGELAYTQITSNVTVSATSEATADTVVTATAFTATGANACVITFYTPALITAALVGASVTLVLYEDGASIGQLGPVVTPAAAAMDVPVTVSRRITPASGSRTYSIRAFRSGGNGIVAAGLGGSTANMPAFIRITQV